MTFGATEHERAAAAYVRALTPERQLTNHDVGRLLLGLGAAIGVTREALSFKLGETQLAFVEQQRKSNAAQMDLLTLD